MDKLTIIPETDGYTVGYDAEYRRTVYDDITGRYNGDVWNAARRVSVTWRLNRILYDALCIAVQTHVDEGGAPFLCDLILDKATVTEHLVRILPGTFGLRSVAQETYNCAATLEALPSRILKAKETWPANLLIT